MSLAAQLDSALHEAKDRVQIKVTPEAVLAAAKKVVAASPKRRFGIIEVKRQLVRDAGHDPNEVRGKFDTYPGDVIKKMMLGRDAAFIADRAYGFWKLRKVPKKKAGVSFAKIDRDEWEVLLNGEFIGTITKQWGLIPGSSTRQSEWTYEWDLDVDELKKLGVDTGGRVPGEGQLRGVNDAKKGIKAFLKRHKLI